jgi:hypothetical protein
VTTSTVRTGTAGYLERMPDVPKLLEGWLDGHPFVVRRRRLPVEFADPIEARRWEWWTVEVNGTQRGERFRASLTDSELSVLEQAKLILRSGGRPPPLAMGQVALPPQ